MISLKGRLHCFYLFILYENGSVNEADSEFDDDVDTVDVVTMMIIRMMMMIVIKVKM